MCFLVAQCRLMVRRPNVYSVKSNSFNRFRAACAVVLDTFKGSDWI